MQKLLPILLGLVLVLLVGGVIYASVIDMPVSQETVTTIIPNDRFSNAR